MTDRSLPGVPSSRTDRARKDPIKAGGVHYTPTELAEFIVEGALAEAPTGRSVRILDPACGDGELLLAAYRVAASRNIEVELVGVDVDAAATEVAVARLAEAGVGASTVVTGDFLRMVIDELRPQLLASEADRFVCQFDAVVSNPPYVRTQTLGASVAQQLGAEFGLKGRVDLYHAFVAAMTASLVPGGALGLVCSNRFMSTTGGRSLRELFASKFQVKAITDFGDTKLFQAAVLPAVVVGTRSDARSTARATFVRMYEDRRPSAELDALPEAVSVVDAVRSGMTASCRVGPTAYLVERGELDLGLGEAPWRMSTETNDSWLDTVHAHTKLRFEDVGKVRVGIKTTADSVFIRKSWDDAPGSPEDALLFPLITHHACGQWRLSSVEHRVLYPYDMTSSKRLALSLSEFPGAAAYLETHRERLEGRKYVIEGGREWFEIWVPQKPAEWSLPKVVFPDISEFPQFSLDLSGSIVNGDCYWIALPDAEALDLGDLLVAVANSDFALDYYDHAFGNRLYAGRRRFITQYVKRFPLPDPLSAQALELVEIARRIRVDGVEPDVVRLNSLVYSAFGVEEPSR